MKAKSNGFFPAIFLLGLFVLPAVLTAQKKARLDARFDALAVFQDRKPRKYRGYLLELRDSSMLLAPSRKVRLPYDPGAMDELYVQDIEKLKFRDRRALTIGIGAGLVVGTLVGLAVVPRESHAEEAGIMAIPVIIAEEVVIKPMVVVGVASLGAIVGAIVGKSFDRKYLINRHQLNYQRYRPELQRYVAPPPDPRMSGGKN